MNKLVEERTYVRAYKEKVTDEKEKIQSDMIKLVREQIQRKREGMRERIETVGSISEVRLYLKEEFRNEMKELDSELGNIYLHASVMLGNIAEQAYGYLTEKVGPLLEERAVLTEEFRIFARAQMEDEKKKARGWEEQQVRTSDMGVSTPYELEKNIVIWDEGPGAHIEYYLTQWRKKNKKKEALQQIEEKMDAYENRVTRLCENRLQDLFNSCIHAGDRLPAAYREIYKRGLL